MYKASVNSFGKQPFSFENRNERGEMLVGNESFRVRKRIRELINSVEKENRIVAIKENIEKFTIDVEEKFPEEQKQRIIFNALVLATELHIGEENRHDEQPYLGHVIEVASLLLNKYGILDEEIITEALLHDAVENRSQELAKTNYNIKFEQKNTRHKALYSIKEYFGDYVRNVIEIVSKPDFEKMIKDVQSSNPNKTYQELKNEFYSDYIANITKNDHAFTVKYADYEVNSKNIPEGGIGKKLRSKYAGALPIFKETIKNIKNSHPLYEHKDAILESLNETKKQYERVL